MSVAECSYANTEAKQLLISWAWQQYQHASEIAVGFAIIAFWQWRSWGRADARAQIGGANYYGRG